MPTNLPVKKETNLKTIRNEKYILIENIVTLIMTVVIVLGLAYVFHSWHCLWGLLLMVNLSSQQKTESDDSN
jgi:hypothetical protein